MAAKRRRRRRKKRYHTGTYLSIKTGKECRYRSGWELEYMQFLDAEPRVAAWDYEAVEVPYVSNLKTGKLRTYYPDFLVTYVDGLRELVEVKPSKRLAQARVQKKLKAAEGWCSAHGATLVVMTEVRLKELGLLKKR